MVVGTATTGFSTDCRALVVPLRLGMQHEGHEGRKPCLYTSVTCACFTVVKVKLDSIVADASILVGIILYFILILRCC